MADGERECASARAATRLAIAAFLAFVVIRIPVMLSFQDTWYPFEVHAGTIARALLDRVDVDFSRLPVVPHARGCVLFGLLLTPVYACFGASAIALKGLALAWNGLAVALLVKLFADLGRRGAAIAATLVFVLAPPMLVKISTVALASHLDSMLFFVLALTCAARFVRSPGTGAAMRFGLVVGLAGYFHLQALLPSLLVFAVLGPSLVRTGRNAVCAALLGAALGAAPSFCFVGGNVALLGASLGTTRPEMQEVAVDAHPPLQKLARLVRHDFAHALEFGDLGDFGATLGAAVAAVLVLLLAIAAWSDRASLRAWSSGASPSRDAVPLGAIFFLHALGVVLLYAISHVQHQDEIAAGLTNRHLAPVYFSCLAGAALGLGSLTTSLRRPLLGATILAVPAAAALPTLCEVTDANRLRHRGECYEWFDNQLDPDVLRDPTRATAFIESVDRGPAPLRPFRFRWRLFDDEDSAIAPAADPHAAMIERSHALETIPNPARRYAAFELGRLAGPSVHFLDASWLRVLARLDDDQRAWTLRGIGSAIEPPRLALRSAGPEFEVRVMRLVRTAPPRDVEWLLEGFGFQLGSVFDPYNLNLRTRMKGLDFLPADHAGAVWRGVGWGASCRYLTTPSAVPADLVLLRYVPAAGRAEFAAAFTMHRTP